MVLPINRGCFCSGRGRIAWALASGYLDLGPLRASAVVPADGHADDASERVRPRRF